MRRSNWIACILLFAGALNVALAKKISVPALFIFGDSLVDAGTNIYVPNSLAVANFPPYGETFFHKPTGRFSNGRTITDFLAQALNLPLVKPYLEPSADHSKGANFASGGSGLLDSSGAIYAVVVPFKQQIQQFQQLATEYKQKYGEQAVQDLISESLFLVAVGSNDILNLNYSNSTFLQTVNETEFFTSLMQIYGGSLMALHAAGTRKFVITGLAPVGCTPHSRLTARQLKQTGCLVAANHMALLFNAALANLLSNLCLQLQDAKILHANPFNLVMELISNGKQYGFAISTTSACCGAGPFNAKVQCGTNVSSPYKVYTGKFPSKFLFWDNQHPTEATYKIIFKAAWLGNTSYIQPYNIHTLIFHT